MQVPCLESSKAKLYSFRTEKAAMFAAFLFVYYLYIDRRVQMEAIDTCDRSPTADR